MKTGKVLPYKISACKRCHPSDCSPQFNVTLLYYAAPETFTHNAIKEGILFGGQIPENRVYSFEFQGASHLNQETYIYIIKTEYGTRFGRLVMVR